MITLMIYFSTTVAAAPMDLSADHPAVVLHHRPEGATFEGIELHYFCLRGLGEVPRLMLEVTNTAYDSVMYFGNKEYKKIAPWGQMPLLKKFTDNQVSYLPQSGSIVRHIAAITGLDGTPYNRALIDSIYEASRDISSKKSAVYLPADDDSKDYKRFHTYLSAAEAILGTNEYFVGNDISYADVGMFHALHGIEEVVPRFLSNYQYTHLDDFVTRMASRPQITQYLVSDRRIPLTENDRGDKPWSPDGYRFTEPLKESVVAETFIFPPTDKDEL